MQKTIFQIIFLISLVSCSEKNSKSTTQEENGAQTSTDESKTIERCFPENTETETHDTIIKDGDFKISITKTSLKTFVINEFLEQKIKHIDKYRDNEIRLKITQNSKTVIDTVFRKELFQSHVDKSFMKIANLYNYWFEKSENGKFIFLGTISKPETDIGFDFNHCYDIKTKSFEIMEIESEDE